MRTKVISFKQQRSAGRECRRTIRAGRHRISASEPERPAIWHRLPIGWQRARMLLLLGCIAGSHVFVDTSSALTTNKTTTIDSTRYAVGGNIYNVDLASCGRFLNTGTFRDRGPDKSVTFLENLAGPLAELNYRLTSIEVNHVNHVDNKPIGLAKIPNPNNRTASPTGGTVTIRGQYRGNEVVLLTGTVDSTPVNVFTHRGYFDKDPKTGTWGCGTVLCANNRVVFDLLVNVTGGALRSFFSDFFLEGRFATRRTLGDDFEAFGAFSLYLPSQKRNPRPPAQVPEPGSTLLLGSAALGLHRLTRSRRACT